MCVWGGGAGWSLAASRVRGLCVCPRFRQDREPWGVVATWQRLVAVAPAPHSSPGHLGGLAHRLPLAPGTPGHGFLSRHRPGTQQHCHVPMACICPEVDLLRAGACSTVSGGPGVPRRALVLWASLCPWGWVSRRGLCPYHTAHRCCGLRGCPLCTCALGGLVTLPGEAEMTL